MADKYAQVKEDLARLSERLPKRARPRPRGTYIVAVDGHGYSKSLVVGSGVSIDLQFEINAEEFLAIDKKMKESFKKFEALNQKLSISMPGKEPVELEVDGVEFAYDHESNTKSIQISGVATI